MRAVLSTAGVRVRIECELPWVDRMLLECCGDALVNAAEAGNDPSALRIRVERSRQPFSVSRLTPLARGAWASDDDVVMHDVCTAGFDLRLRMADGRPVLTYRWRPPRTTRAASMMLRARFRLLLRAALLQYPALWWASTQGAVPLHAPVCAIDGAVIMLAGPAGVGKTTLLTREIAEGAVATSDNLCASDGRDCWGVVEPVRVEGSTGRRSTHGRREIQLASRADALTPDLVVVLRRGRTGTTVIQQGSSDHAARTLAGGTYMAGELRRYWGFAATLASATGRGPVHPPVSDVAEKMTRRLACMDVAMGDRNFRLRDVLSAMETSTCA